MNPANMQVSSKTGVLIGIPTLGRPVSLAWASAYKSLHPPINYNMNVMQINGAPVAEARNAISAKALELDSRYVFFLGDDVVVPPHTLRQFITRMENNPTIGVIGGIYCAKSDPPAPLVFRGNGQGSYWDWKVGEFFEVTGLGMDCTLVRTEIFKKLSKPWYKTTNSDQFENGINQADQWTEDLWFLKRVSSETDYKIYCDATILCDHEDAYSGKKWNLPAYSLPTRKAAFSDGELKIIDIGSGETRRDFNGIKPIRVDIREECEPDYRCDVRNLPFADNSFDIVFSSHVLEHFDRATWKSVLTEWTRLVAKDGKLILILPNIMWAAQRMVNDKVIDNDVLNVLYGAQSNPFDYHYNGLTPERVKEALTELGFEIKEVKCEYYNMVIEAVRRVPKVIESREAVVATIVPAAAKHGRKRK